MNAQQTIDKLLNKGVVGMVGSDFMVSLMLAAARDIVRSRIGKSVSLKCVQHCVTHPQGNFHLVIK